MLVDQRNLRIRPNIVAATVIEVTEMMPCFIISSFFKCIKSFLVARLVSTASVKAVVKALAC